MKLNELKTKISDFYHKDNKHKAGVIAASLVPVLLVGGVSVAVALNNPVAAVNTAPAATPDVTADTEQKEGAAADAQDQSAADAQEQVEGASTDASSPSTSDTSSSAASTAPSATTTSTSSSTSSPNAVTATSPLPPTPAGKKGHWEKKLVKAAYDEPVYEKVQKTRVLAEGYTRKEAKGPSYRRYRVDGYKAYTEEEARIHGDKLMAEGKSTQNYVERDLIDVYYPPVTETYYEWVQTGTKHHDAVYENVWIDG